MLNLLVGPIVDLAETHFENKANEKKAVHERKLKSISQEADWERFKHRMLATVGPMSGSRYSYPFH